ncbi:MAG: AAA family ATPase [Elusimicrobiaceae bacterium]|nr:AAA family ATPase [Elusimicrobiaceae bacterium]
MKLEQLTLKNFGALGDRSFDFHGRSAVLYGPNEAGKTTLIDAVTAAMFGAPRGNTTFGKKYFARYGGAAQAQVRLKTNEGTPVAAAQDAPLQPAADFPPELFRTLLTIRAGDAHIAHEERNFMEAFTNRVLGGGKVNLGRGMTEVRKIYSPDRRSRWYTLLTEAQDTLNMLRAKIYKTGDIESSVRARNELSALIAEHAAERDSLAQRKIQLEAERALAALDELKKLQAELLGTEREIDNLSGVNRNIYQYYRTLDEEVKGLLAKKRSHGARLAELEKNIADQQGAKAALEALALNMPSQDLREDASRALARYRRSQELAAALAGGGNAGLSATAGLTAAVAMIGGGTALGWQWYAAWAAGLAAGALAYFLARNMAVFSPAAAKARHELEEAKSAYHGALARLGDGWTGSGPAETAAKFERAEHEFQRTSGKLETVRALLSELERRLASEKAQLAETEATYSQFSGKLERELAALGAASVDALNGKVEKLEYLFCSRDDLAGRIAREVGTAGKDVKPALELRIQELQRALPPEAEGAAPRSAREIELDLKRTDKELQSLGAQLEQDRRNMAENNEKLSRLEGEVGMPAAEVFVRERKLENEINDIIRWRDAAEEAYRLLSEISKANEDMVRNCVENAAPVFSALSGGVYTSLELRGGNPFEENGMTVVHGELGAHPVEWLSSGAQDILWLAVRIIFASSGYARPAFMILDEPFHALDPGRTANALKALTEGALADWQFIILTKDPAVTSLAQEAGFSRLDLITPVQELK